VTASQPYDLAVLAGVGARSPPRTPAYMSFGPTDQPEPSLTGVISVTDVTTGISNELQFHPLKLIGNEAKAKTLPSLDIPLLAGLVYG
jgi:hypothetical protein